MKGFQKFLTKKAAQNISKFMNSVCYVIIALLLTILALSFMGRLEYNLSYNGENFPNAIYAEEDHNFSSRSLTVSSTDSLRIRTQSEDGKIQLISLITITLLYTLQIIPTIFAFWFLSKVFKNVSNGEIFIDKNAQYLLYYAIIQIIVAVVLPFIKILIVQIANLFVTDVIMLSTGQNMLNQVIPSFAFLVAAYIIHYGVHLQNEADHTL